MLIAVPSKGRAGRVMTQAVVPSASIFVPHLEAAAYEQMGVRNVVPVPDAVRGITATRNWILRQADDRRVVMIDDDVRTQGYTELFARNCMRHLLDEATWLGEFAKLFDVTEDLGYRIWGLRPMAPPARFTRSTFCWRSYVTASCMGIGKRRKIAAWAQAPSLRPPRTHDPGCARAGVFAGGSAADPNGARSRDRRRRQSLGEIALGYRGLAEAPRTGGALDEAEDVGIGQALPLHQADRAAGLRPFDVGHLGGDQRSRRHPQAVGARSDGPGALALQRVAPAGGVPMQVDPIEVLRADHPAVFADAIRPPATAVA
jgi:hypothetical protein